MQATEVLDNGVAIEDAQFGEARETDVRMAGPDGFCFCICSCWDKESRSSSSASMNSSISVTAPQ